MQLTWSRPPLLESAPTSLRLMMVHTHSFAKLFVWSAIDSIFHSFNHSISVRSFICSCVCLFIHLFIRWFLCLFVRPSVCSSICLFIHVTVCFTHPSCHAPHLSLYTAWTLAGLITAFNSSCQTWPVLRLQKVMIPEQARTAC